MSILTSIKQRPDNQKKFFSVVLALIITFIIVGVWFSFSGNSIDSSIASEEPSKLSSISPLQVIKDEFSQTFSSLKEASINDDTVIDFVEIIDDALASSTSETDFVTASSSEQSNPSATGTTSYNLN